MTTYNSSERLGQPNVGAVTTHHSKGRIRHNDSTVR
jgi:hypothetical protein